MEEKRICCCGSKIWTIVIGWIHVILSLGSFAALTFVLVRIILPARYSSLNERTLMTQEMKILYLNIRFNVSLTIFIFALIMASLNFVMALVLLYGTHKKRAGCIQAWIVFTVGCICLGDTIAIVGCRLFPTWENISITLTCIVISVTIQGFFLWVATIRKNEIKNFAADQALIFPKTHNKRQKYSQVDTETQFDPLM